MVEPIIEKIDLLDTEYAQLLNRGIDPQKYLEDSKYQAAVKLHSRPVK